MKRVVLLTGVALAVSSSLAWASPESLLPPGFDNPTPTPTPTPKPATPAPPPRRSATPVPAERPGAAPASQAASQNPASQPGASGGADGDALAKLPSLAEIEDMETDEVNELFGLKPKFDVPPAARRAVEQVGVISAEEGGFPAGSLAKQPASLIRAALKGTQGPLVSRWGHILLRRALASRMDAPEGMNPVEFAALRAALLNRMGEGQVARTLVQDVDSANYNLALADAAFDAYLQTGDLIGMCPVARLKDDLRSDPQWEMTRSICAAFAGNTRSSERQLNRALAQGLAPRVDVLLAQRFAGAAGEGRRAVNIEWDDVNEMTPWRFALSAALGVDMPESLLDDAGPYYQRSAVLIPALPLAMRAEAADRAGMDGILSSAAMVDLYSQLHASAENDGALSEDTNRLRNAYVATGPAERLAAMRELWGNGTPDYGKLVLTAYAAARLPVDEDLADDPADLIASMLAAGLDRNAMRWGGTVSEGSEAWGLLAVAQPERSGTVSSGAVDSFIDEDSSAGQRKSRFLVAGLAGLGRLDNDDMAGFGENLGIDFNRESPWSRTITQAADYRNAALVAILAGLGMQGDGWDKMTARQLYLIVRSLDKAGLNAEARMIAAEAVARG
ncbi:hypothetical protein D6851_12795 [Altericroceibacterium spongiae]|uniref:Antifreeze protein n=1 Tax=Altericroceibacterium spongiae TaxID=2320269 RepID=A0A420EFF7_9SPHN|nr:hypothetical protein [Altericroceibacterium spongiae]RKF19326.1 hypothetical protein D6851_12795 [Altericroceibacterium spongiae]